MNFKDEKATRAIIGRTIKVTEMQLHSADQELMALEEQRHAAKEKVERLRRELDSLIEIESYIPKIDLHSVL